ncbi:hypothetical protein ACFW04_014642 [Cataglyphis niger]
MFYEYKTCNHLMTDSKSKRYNDNKKWFNLYLKLFILQFIVMGIKWSRLFCFPNNSGLPYCVLYAINLVGVMSNLCIFIIFVWNKNIKRMLLKQFGCGFFLNDQYATNATSLSISTCTITSREMRTQKKMSSCGQKIYHETDSFGGTKF